MVRGVITTVVTHSNQMALSCVVNLFHYIAMAGMKLTGEIRNLVATVTGKKVSVITCIIYTPDTCEHFHLNVLGPTLGS